MIEIKSFIDAPIAKVWDAYNTPADIMQWNHATADWYCPHAENDLQSGGRFCYKMAARDGSFSFDFTGTFTIVKPSEMLAYTIDDGRKVEVSFTSEKEGTIVLIHFEPELQNPAEMQKQGWQMILDNFKKYVEPK